MDVTAFAINLDRSTDRWLTLSGQVRKFGLPLIRISAVDGTEISETEQEAVDRLAVMRHPWDVALERGWDHGAQVYVLRKNIVTVAGEGTTIATRDIYRSVKFPKSKRLATYVRRLRDDFARFSYAFQA